MDTSDDVQTIQLALSRLILQQLSGVASKQYFPTHDADRDDDTIKRGKDRAKELRRIREEFENLSTGVL